LVEKYLLLTRLQGFFKKNPKNQINKAYSTGKSFPFELIFGPEKGRLLLLPILLE
jgi:hypothetical protein